MADADEPLDQQTKRRRRLWPRRKRFQFLLILLLLLFASSVLSWQSRDDIADDLITSQLDVLGIEATYEIESIGVTEQVLTNFVVGDPNDPDLVIERVELVPVVQFLGADIGTLTLIRPRLRASYVNGEFSMGALDTVFESESETDPALPGWNLRLVDARARIRTDFGAVGIKADGAGRLNGGFQGVAALAAPDWQMGTCSWAAAVMTGEIRTSQGRPHFDGPLSMRGLSCSEPDISMPEVLIQSSLRGDDDLGGLSGDIQLSQTDGQIVGVNASQLAAALDFDWRDGIGNGRYDLAADRLTSDYANISNAGFEGGIRYRTVDGRWELDGGLSGNDLTLGTAVGESLTAATEAGAGTLAAPLLVRFSKALNSGLIDSRLEAELLIRQTGDGLSLVIPEARVRDGRGDALLAVSQAQWSMGDDAGSRMAGNFSVGGANMPQIDGRMEGATGASPALRMRMAPYRAGQSELGIPQLTLSPTSGGVWRISGSAIASGDIPGGSVKGLVLPINGMWSDRAGLALWQRCTDIGFTSLQLADLQLARDRIAICPEGQSAIVRSGNDGLQINGSIRGLDLSGQLGDSPIRLASDQIGISGADGVTAQNVQVTLGETDALSQLEIDQISAAFGEGTSGTFAGLSGGLSAVPLDISAGQGDWRFADGILALSDTQFFISDRTEDERFEPLYARGASLLLAENRITANATMRHPGTDRTIVVVDLSHDLGTSTGFADLNVPGILFDDQLEPGARIDQCDDSVSTASGATGLTCLATGVIALAEGVITGSGRIDWDPENVTSSGSFSTDEFDFAAAFGPVQNVSGTIEFSDLLSLTTDGNQQLNIGIIDPGIEVYDGTLEFALIDGTQVSVKGGEWPFFGGTMYLRPTDLDFGVSEQRSYVIEIEGVDAAQFVTAMEFSNISASGTFDGTIPLIFDVSGDGRIVNGLLLSRPPGGNLSYVGELTYEDTGFIANYAFQSLRSLDFNQMMVEMDGPLTGEIITRMLFDGVSQGEGADRNFITRRLAKLPIRFNVNIRASFYQLLNDLLKTYDPASNIEPSSLGLIRGPDGRMVRPSVLDKTPPAESEAAEDEPLIQTQESETLP
ncbi:hypothetical protein BPTFM16_00654 [Altererythrobacter insulae]|nr:hypothetical protein BPTFM16_00654 [Altererythrobacter insulae]